MTDQHPTSASLHTRERQFSISRILGSAGVRVTEYVLTYEGTPSFSVSVMEFRGGKVTRETQYFGDPLPAASWRAHWVKQLG